jgi:alkylhydroperoxidase/carboxymuconolactone decarboxylase family protein YurZ
MTSRPSTRMMIFHSNGKAKRQPSRLPFFIKDICLLLTEGYGRGNVVQIRKKILDYEYEEVLDVKTRELIRVGCAVAVGCPT